MHLVNKHHFFLFMATRSYIGAATNHPQYPNSTLSYSLLKPAGATLYGDVSKK